MIKRIGTPFVVFLLLLLTGCFSIAEEGSYAKKVYNELAPGDSMSLSFYCEEGRAYQVYEANPDDYSSGIWEGHNLSYRVRFPDGSDWSNGLFIAPEDGHYEAVVTNEEDYTIDLYLSVGQDLNINTDITIYGDPESDYASVGDMVYFYCNADGSNLQYEWYKNDVLVSTQHILSFEVTADDDQAVIYCVVKNGFTSKTSNKAHLTVTGGVVVTKPQILTQPKNVTVHADETASFVLMASGENLSFRWEYSEDGLSWGVIDIANQDWVELYDDSLVWNSAIIEEDGYRFRCIVSNSAGSDTSSVVRLTVMSSNYTDRSIMGNEWHLGTYDSEYNTLDYSIIGGSEQVLTHNTATEGAAVVQYVLPRFDTKFGNFDKVVLILKTSFPFKVAIGGDGGEWGYECMSTFNTEELIDTIVVDKSAFSVDWGDASSDKANADYFMVYAEGLNGTENLSITVEDVLLRTLN